MYPPSSVATVIVASPSVIAVTVAVSGLFSFGSTSAMLVSLDVYVTFLLVASSGSICAVSCAVSPTLSAVSSGVNVMPVTGMKSSNCSDISFYADTVLSVTDVAFNVKLVIPVLYTALVTVSAPVSSTMLIPSISSSMLHFTFSFGSKLPFASYLLQCRFLLHVHLSAL